jgi:hypothetical protein
MSPEEAHLCPVHAVAEWLWVSRIQEGYLFQRMASGDCVAEKNAPMVSSFHVMVHAAWEFIDINIHVMVLDI